VQHSAYELSLSGQQRARDGCVLSFENAAGKRLVLHREGSPLQVIGPMCDDALRLDPSFRVVAYSTPSTVYTDLVGGRMRRDSRNEEFEQEQSLPEKMMLQRAHRPEMLHERLALLGQDERENRLHRAARKRARG
jgi:hypothetical protein